MKKFILKFGLTILMITTALILNAGMGELGVVQAEEEPEAAEEEEPEAVEREAPTPREGVDTPQQWLMRVGTEIGREGPEMPEFIGPGIHPDAPAPYEPGVAAVTSPLLFLIDLFRYVISGIAFVVIVISAIKLIAKADEEDAKKVKNHLLMGVVGLLVIQLADPIVKRIAFGERGEAFEDPATAELFAEEAVVLIRSIIGMIHVFLGAVAVLVIVIRGFRLLTSGGDEEQLTKAKRHVLYAVVGLAIVGLSELVVRGFIFPEEGETLPDVGLGRTIIISITNYISGFVSIVAFVMLFYAGYYYVVSGGQEEANEKVKKIVTAAVIGLVLALAAFAIVNTVLQVGDPTAG